MLLPADEIIITASGFIVNTAGDKILREVLIVMIYKVIYFCKCQIKPPVIAFYGQNLSEESAMNLDEERVNMMVTAMGRAIMELSLANQPITQEAVVEKLEQYRKETGNVIGKGVNRDAAEIVRKGSAAID